MEPLTDNTLLHRIANGEAGALALLYDRYSKLAYSLAYHMLGNGTDAEEVAQESFIKVWRMARTFDATKGGARTWLLAIVRHRAIDLLRQRRGQTSLSLLPEFDLPLAATGDLRLELDHYLTRDAVLQALNQIPREQQQVLELAYFHGYTHAEIAQRLALPLGTVKARIRLGIEKLRALLREHREA